MTASAAPRTLAVDIGGTNLKAGIVAPDGMLAGAQIKAPTPRRGGADAVIAAIATLAEPLGAFERVSVGFPGAIRHGVILTAPNLGSAHWHGIALADRLGAELGRPVRLANDATMQGLGAISGAGIECILTLGTGMGFALYRDGIPAPQIELGRHPAGRYPSYDDFIGDAALRKIAAAAWNRRLRTVIERVAALVNYDRLYLGGGNSRLVRQPLPPATAIVPNEAALKGGIRLWDPAVDASVI